MFSTKSGKLHLKTLLTLTTLGSTSLLWGLAGAETLGENNVKTINGATIYNQRCVKCHGVGAKGVEDFTPDLGKVTKRAGWEDVINNGKGSMPGFKDSLTAKQVKAVLTYVRSIGSSTKKSAPPARGKNQPRTS